MNIFNSRRPRMDPCGTPFIIPVESLQCGPRLNDCSMKHYIVQNIALFSHAHVNQFDACVFAR